MTGRWLPSKLAYTGSEIHPKSISSLWRTAMSYYVGLDVAMEETAICIVDDQRRIVREGKAARLASLKPSPRSFLRPD